MTQLFNRNGHELSGAVATKPNERVVLHLAGPDGPGVTARLTQIIAEENAHLITIGQSVLHGYLALSAVIDVPPESVALRRILFAASKLGYRLNANPLAEESHHESAMSPSICITIIGDDLSDGCAIAEFTRFLADRGLNIREIKTLSTNAHDTRDGAAENPDTRPPTEYERLNGMEFIAESSATGDGAADIVALRGDVLALAGTLGVDVGVQRNDIFRRTKRLVCLDVDSTFAQGEFIDDLADLAGCKSAVAQITARAMRGELDFSAALRERVALLKGLPLSKARELVGRVQLTPGALEFAKTLKSLGFRVGLVSGGFDFFVEALKEKYGLDFAFANELEITSNGTLSGGLVGTILDPERKAQILKDMCQVYGCRPEQSIAIGDGANDILMLQTAGLGIAFRAKKKLQAAADMSLNHHARMDVLLFLIGFHARDLSDLDRPQVEPAPVI